MRNAAIASGACCLLLVLLLDVVACTPTSDLSVAVQSVVIAAELQQPRAIAIDLNGDCYIVDSTAARIIRVSVTGQVLGSWGVQGSGVGQLLTPSGIVVDPDFNVFVADTDNDRIQKFSRDGQPIAAFGSSGTAVGQFRRPLGLVLDSHGNVLVADSGNHRVQKLNQDGQPLGEWDQIDDPEAVAVDSQGNVFAADTTTNRIDKLGSDGSSSPVASSTQLKQPSGLTFDADGSLYVADAGNDRVLKLGPNGQLLAKYGGHYDKPVGVVHAPGEALVVVDSGDHRAQIITAPGAVAAPVPSVTPKQPTRCPPLPHQWHQKSLNAGGWSLPDLGS